MTPAMMGSIATMNTMMILNTSTIANADGSPESMPVWFAAILGVVVLVSLLYIIVEWFRW